MIYDIFKASKKLETTVKQYVVIHSIDGLNKLMFLPNGCNFLVFNRGLVGYTKVHNEDAKYYMPQKYSVSVKSNKIRRFVLDNQLSSQNIIFPIILVELTPIGFYKLFKIDASVLNSGYLEIQKNIVDEYLKKLYNFATVSEELEYLNESLYQLVVMQNTLNMPIQKIIDKIVDSYHYEVNVEKLVEDFGCSQSTMERDFKKIIGLTPKNFIFISKFCKTVLAYIGDECTFKELTYLYSDNSHFNAVFKKFFGVNPSVILEEVASNKIKIHQMRRLSND